MYRDYQQSIVPPAPVPRYAQLFYVHFRPSDKSLNDVYITFHVSVMFAPNHVDYHGPTRTGRFEP